MHRRAVLLSFAALILPHAAAAEARPDTPEALVRALIATHAPFILDVGPGVFDSEEATRRFFTPDLAEAILAGQRLARANPGEVVEGTLDFDPITAANAPQMRDLMVEPSEVTGERATVVTTFLRDAETIVRVRYSLRAESEAWRIDDIAGEASENGEAWSLRRVLRLPP